MTCAELKLLMADYWSEMLPDAARLAFEEHLGGCEVCHDEARRLGAMWRDMGSLPFDSPGDEMRARFDQALAGYRDGAALARASRFPWKRLQALAAAVVLLAAGVGIGYGWRSSQTQTGGEIGQLRAEVSTMRQLVTLSLLQQSSASERLRGVSWAYQVEPSDTQVPSALLSAVNHDPSVNVRLAAVDALRPFAGSAVVNAAMIQALPRETAPIVQMALIELMADLKEKQAARALERIASDDSAEAAVRERAQWALEQLR
jgi:hypothetical protein